MRFRSLLAAALLAAPTAHAGSFTFDAWDNSGHTGFAYVTIGDDILDQIDAYIAEMAAQGKSYEDAYAEFGGPAMFEDGIDMPYADFHIFAYVENPRTGEFWDAETHPHDSYGQPVMTWDQVTSSPFALSVNSPDVQEADPFYDNEYTTYGGFSLTYAQPLATAAISLKDVNEALQNGVSGVIYYSGTVDGVPIAREISFGTQPDGPAPVPLPAGGLLMLGGIGSFAALRARRRNTAPHT